MTICPQSILVADTAASRTVRASPPKKGTLHLAFNIRQGAVALMRIVAQKY
jgi:hypothetical protein